MIIKSIIAIALLSLIGAGLYAVYHAGWNAREVIALQEKANAEAALKDVESQWRMKYDMSLRDAARREFQIRSDAHDAHAAADGLRAQLADTAREFAHYTPSALAAYATELANVFRTCLAEYESVAGDADQWENSAITHHEAWPK
jgi:hypothetical protein